MQKPTYLVTGAAGFIGSHLVDYLLDINPDSEVIIVDKISYCSSLKNIPHDLRVTFYQCNIQNKEMIYHILKKHRVSHVLHLAAEAHVDNSFNNSVHFTQENVLGTHILLEQCRRYGKIQFFLHVSTDEVYGETLDQNSVTEDSLLMPTNPYAASKAAAEFIVQSYIRSYKFPALIVRMNNVFGPRQFPEKVMPKFIQLALSNKPLPIQGDGKQLRAFIFVKDVCRALLVVVERGQIGQVYNIGSPVEMSVLEIADKIWECLGNGKTASLVYEADRLFNDKRYFINSDKLKTLGWVDPPESKFISDLQETIAWYRENPKWFE
jgi:UDP-glucose 4,6-dehydratase